MSDAHDRAIVIGQRMTNDVDDNLELRFCALEYRAQGFDERLSDHDRIMMVLVLLPHSELKIRLHPNWRRIVEIDDWQYTIDLVDDFRERMHVDPEVLFAQVQTLGVGPLITYAIGTDLRRDRALMELYEKFDDI